MTYARTALELLGSFDGGGGAAVDVNIDRRLTQSYILPLASEYISPCVSHLFPTSSAHSTLSATPLSTEQLQRRFPFPLPDQESLFAVLCPLFLS